MYEKNKQTLRIVLVGATPLLFRCLTHLQSCGHLVVSVYTNDTPTCNRAYSNVNFFPLKEATQISQRDRCDYLFSIANEKILPVETISFPEKSAINYHDSLLPAFAGRNAAAWSIFFQRKTHGVTWHVMEKQVDSGDIVFQQQVDLRDGESAFELNIRCFDAAYHGFCKLIGHIEKQTLSFVTQNLKERSYFSETDFLPGGGIVNWASTASQISAMVNASDFGNYYPELGRTKIYDARGCYVVNKAHACCDTPQVPPCVKIVVR